MKKINHGRKPTATISGFKINLVPTTGGNTEIMFIHNKEKWKDNLSFRSKKQIPNKPIEKNRKLII